MQMRTFWALNAALALGCGGSDYSEYYLPTTTDGDTGSTTSGTASTTESTATGAGGSVSTSGTGNGTSGSGGRGGSGGSGSSDAGATGCRGAPEWMMGQTYPAGATVRGVCMNPGGGSTMCDVGKTYLWTCNQGAVCGIYAPGVDGWWGAWTVGMRCD
jgi:hypothetical protein